MLGAKLPSVDGLTKRDLRLKGGGGVGEIQVLGFVFSACAFKFGALFAVDREIAVSDTILRVEREKRR